METISNDHFNGHDILLPEKPQVLKTLCTISFVGCGLMILVSILGLLCFLVTPDMINEFWPKLVEAQPILNGQNAMEFCHKMGLLSIYTLIGNIISLTGVTMMYNLNKFGFIVYSVAEIGLNFFRIHLGGTDQAVATSSLIFMILLDAVFIVLYARNLKYMKGNNQKDTATIQTP